MDAIHSLWTKPNTKLPDDFEILSAVLSALKWREKNGSISMITDSCGADFLHALGISEIWDEINTSLDFIPSSVNPQNYWAAGKIFALSKQIAPVVSLDTDFIVWNKINFPKTCASIHKEEINEVYPKHPDFLEFAYDMDFSAKPSNTAFIYINNQEFLNFYCKKSLEFMSKYTSPELAYMLFAEQRLFSMCAEKMNIEIHEFMPLDKLFTNQNNDFTHLWGHKTKLRQNKNARMEFNTKILTRLYADFPEYAKIFLKLKTNLGL